ALDLADAEAPADEVVQAHAAHRDLPARFTLGQAGALDLLGLDERDPFTRRRAVGEEVAIAFESLARDCVHRVDGAKLAALLGADVDRLDHQATAFPKRFSASARLRAASTSRLRGAAVVTRSSSRCWVMWPMSAIAWLNAASFAFDGFCIPLTLRTYWS